MWSRRGIVSISMTPLAIPSTIGRTRSRWFPATRTELDPTAAARPCSCTPSWAGPATRIWITISESSTSIGPWARSPAGTAMVGTATVLPSPATATTGMRATPQRHPTTVSSSIPTRVAMIVANRWVECGTATRCASRIRAGGDRVAADPTGPTVRVLPVSSVRSSRTEPIAIRTTYGSTKRSSEA